MHPGCNVHGFVRQKLTLHSIIFANSKSFLFCKKLTLHPTKPYISIRGLYKRRTGRPMYSETWVGLT